MSGYLLCYRLVMGPNGRCRNARHGRGLGLCHPPPYLLSSRVETGHSEAGGTDAGRHPGVLGRFDKCSRPTSDLVRTVNIGCEPPALLLAKFAPVRIGPKPDLRQEVVMIRLGLSSSKCNGVPQFDSS